MKIPRVMRDDDDHRLIFNWIPEHVRAPSPRDHAIRFYRIIQDEEKDSHGYRKRWWPIEAVEVVAPDDLIGVDETLCERVKFETRQQWHDFWDSAVGEGETWDRMRWIRYAPLGSLFIKGKAGKLEFYVKFDNGADRESDNWALQGRVLPELDAETISQLTNDELQLIRDTEDAAALQRMANVDTIEREQKRRYEAGYVL